MPAFPVARSAAVVIGEVTQARAYLSEDQTDIYSEFALRVDEVLKNENLNPLNVGGEIVFERKGGRVRFQSGEMAASLVNHQDMPRLGGKYVLFLTHSFPMGGQIEDFYLLTGYELRGNRVYALDKVASGHPIATYNGADEIAFRNALRIAVTSSLATQPK